MTDLIRRSEPDARRNKPGKGGQGGLDGDSGGHQDRRGRLPGILGLVEALNRSFQSPRTKLTGSRSGRPTPEHVNKEINHRSRGVGILSNAAAVIRLVGAVLIDMHDEWIAGDRRRPYSACIRGDGSRGYVGSGGHAASRGYARACGVGTWRLAGLLVTRQVEDRCQ